MAFLSCMYIYTISCSVYSCGCGALARCLRASRALQGAYGLWQLAVNNLERPLSYSPILCAQQRHGVRVLCKCVDKRTGVRLLMVLALALAHLPEVVGPKYVPYIVAHLDIAHVRRTASTVGPVRPTYPQSRSRE